MSALGRLREIFDTLERMDVPSFRAFMDTTTKKTPAMQHTAEAGFMSVMRLVDSASGENRDKMSAKSVKCETALSRASADISNHSRLGSDAR